LKSVVGGHIRYFGVPGNRYALAYFRFTVSNLWHHVLRRRSQKGRIPWERMKRLIQRWLPPAHICLSRHPRRTPLSTARVRQGAWPRSRRRSAALGRSKLLGAPQAAALQSARSATGNLECGLNQFVQVRLNARHA